MNLFVKKYEICMRIPGTDTLLTYAGGPYSEDELDEAVAALKKKLKDNEIAIDSELDLSTDDIEIVIEDVYEPFDTHYADIYLTEDERSIKDPAVPDEDDVVTVGDVMHILTKAYEVHKFDIKIQDEHNPTNYVYFKSTNDLVLNLYRNNAIKEFRLTDRNNVVFTLYSCTDSTM